MKKSGPNDRLVTAHAIQVGDRITTAGIEGETLSTAPLAIKIEKDGIAVVFRYGVAVLSNRNRTFWKTWQCTYRVSLTDTRKKARS
jgi:hypothetical protein